MDGDTFEDSLETHLKETRIALEDVEQCIADEGGNENSELLKLKEELQTSILETETVLLQLKKDRITEEHCKEDISESESESSSDALDSDNDDDWEQYTETALSEMQAAVEDAARRGQQTETAHFADWEATGRGIASKLMVKMGYVHGKGLGKDKQGIASHIIAKQHGSGKAGLGNDDAVDISLKKRTKRGGLKATRKRLRRQGRLSSKSKKAETSLNGDDGMFSLINSITVVQAHPHTDQNKDVQRQEHQRTETSGRHCHDSDSRNQLVKQEDAIATLRKSVAHLESSVRRNHTNPAMLKALQSKLTEAKDALKAAENKHSKLSLDLRRHNSHKQWGRF